MLKSFLTVFCFCFTVSLSTAQQVTRASSGGSATLPISARDLASDSSGNGVDQFKPTATSTTLTVLGGYIRFVTTTYTNLNVTATLTGGTTAVSATVTSYLFISNTGALILQVPNSLASSWVTTTNITVASVATPSFPDSSYPIATIPLTGNGATVTFGTVADKRASLGVDPITSGTGLSCTNASGLVTCAIDTAVVPQLGGNNIFTGVSDNRSATKSYVAPTAASDPGTCTVAEQYYNTTTNQLRDCTATNKWIGIDAGTFGGAGVIATNSITITTSDTLLASADLPGTLPAGACVIAETTVSVASAINAVTFKLWFGTATPTTGSSVTASAGTNAGPYTLRGKVCNDNAVTNAQHLFLEPVFTQTSGGFLTTATGNQSAGSKIWFTAAVGLVTTTATVYGFEAAKKFW